MGNFSQALNRRVTIQAPGTIRDEGGGVIEGWAEYAQAWASIRKTNGMESIRAGAEGTTVQASIRMRYRTDIDASMRIVHGTTIYKILGVLTDEQRKLHVDFVCEIVT